MLSVDETELNFLIVTHICFTDPQIDPAVQLYNESLLNQTSAALKPLLSLTFIWLRVALSSVRLLALESSAVDRIADAFSSKASLLFCTSSLSRLVKQARRATTQKSGPGRAPRLLINNIWCRQNGQDFVTDHGTQGQKESPWAK